MNEELQQLKREVESLKAWKKSLEASHSIPLNIDQSFRKRFEVISLKSQTAKAADSENRTVNEGGVATYDVLKAPDGFDLINDSGKVKYFPWFNLT